MFSLFNKKRITIKSVSIPDSGWTKVKDDNSIIQWINPEQTIAISINYFESIPDIPTVKNINVLRAFYRNIIAEVDGGLIELELYKRQQFDIVKSIFKIPQKPSGMTYIGSLTIPFSTCSFVLKVQAVESGVTGMREAVTVNKFLSIGTFDDAAWASDPYDKEFKTGALMNKSEVQSYDIDFPDHPLSQVRTLLSEIEKGLKWESAVEKLHSLDR
jgi:hypothetical protein